MKTTTIPKNAKNIPLRPLALGEKTGHHHSLYAAEGVCLEEEAQMFEVRDDDGVTHYLRVSGEGVSLQHQEHKTAAVPPGEYRVVLQRENTDWGSRAVLD